MSANENGARAKDELIIAALVGGATYAGAATTARVSKATVARRMADVEFRVKVAQGRHEIAEALRGRLVEAASDAVTTIHDLSTSASSESVRLSASRAVLDLVLRPRDLDEAEVVRILRELVEVALNRIPDPDAQWNFLQAARATAAPPLSK
jgi:hypothetical protein